MIGYVRTGKFCCPGCGGFVGVEDVVLEGGERRRGGEEVLDAEIHGGGRGDDRDLGVGSNVRVGPETVIGNLDVGSNASAGPVTVMSDVEEFQSGVLGDGGASLSQGREEVEDVSGGEGSSAPVDDNSVGNPSIGPGVRRLSFKIRNSVTVSPLIGNKPRQLTSTRDREILESYFATNRYPTPAEREELARQTGTTALNVEV